MRQHPKSSRAGYTLFQLLVVLAIICVLTAITIPAIQQVREDARRATCMNNLRQLMLSILNYESAHQHFPQAAGVALEQNNQLPETTKHYSGFLTSFQYVSRYSGPYFDEEVEIDGVYFPAYPDVETSGFPLWTEQRPWYVCPSLPVSNSKFAPVHYAFSIGDVAKNVHSPKLIRGAFAVGKSQIFENLTDGSSNTIGLVEIGGFSDRSFGRRFAINQPAKFLENPSLVSELNDGWGNYKSSVALSKTERGGNWANGTGGPGLANTILPPGSPSLLVGGDSQVDGFFSASMNHGQTVTIALCDGSCHASLADIDVGDQTHRSESAEELFGSESHYGVWGAIGSCNGDEYFEAF